MLEIISSRSCPHVRARLPPNMPDLLALQQWRGRIAGMGCGCARSAGGTIEVVYSRTPEVSAFMCSQPMSTIDVANSSLRMLLSCEITDQGPGLAIPFNEASVVDRRMPITSWLPDQGGGLAASLHTVVPGLPLDFAYNPAGKSNSCALLCLLELLVTGHVQFGLLDVCGNLIKGPAKHRADKHVLTACVKQLSAMDIDERHDKMQALGRRADDEPILEGMRRLIHCACEGWQLPLEDEWHVSASERDRCAEEGTRIPVGAIAAFLCLFPMRVAILTELGDGHIIRRDTGADGMPYAGALLARHHHLVCLAARELRLKTMMPLAADMRVSDLPHAHDVHEPVKVSRGWRNALAPPFR